MSGIPSAVQNIDIENCSEKQLLEVLPGLWERYLNARDAACKVNFFETIVARRAVEDATENVVLDVARSASIGTCDTYNTNFVNNWGPSGKVYNFITSNSKVYGRAYLKNLVIVLQGQTIIIESITNSNNQTQGSHQTINVELATTADTFRDDYEQGFFENFEKSHRQIVGPYDTCLISEGAYFIFNSSEADTFSLAHSRIVPFDHDIENFSRTSPLDFRAMARKSAIAAIVAADFDSPETAARAGGWATAPGLKPWLHLTTGLPP